MTQKELNKMQMKCLKLQQWLYKNLNKEQQKKMEDYVELNILLEAECNQ